MEVVDDMKLGKLVKRSGFRSCVAIAQEFVTVRWHAGAGNVIRGVTKNFFAAFGYNLAFAAVALAGMLLLNVVPFFAVFAGHGWIRVFSAIAVAVALGMHASVDVVNKVSPLYALTHPIGAVLFCYMICAVRRGDDMAGRSDVARHVLSIERFETWRCIAELLTAVA